MNLYQPFWNTILYFYWPSPCLFPAAWSWLSSPTTPLDTKVNGVPRGASISEPTTLQTLQWFNKYMQMFTRRVIQQKERQLRSIAKTWRIGARIKRTRLLVTAIRTNMRRKLCFVLPSLSGRSGVTGLLRRDGQCRMFFFYMRWLILPPVCECLGRLRTTPILVNSRVRNAYQLPWKR